MKRVACKCGSANLIVFANPIITDRGIENTDGDLMVKIVCQDCGSDMLIKGIGENPGGPAVGFTQN